MDKELKALYLTYRNKPVEVENVLGIATDFVLDLINVFGDRLDNETPLKPNWKPFAPFEFILALNNILAKVKSGGYEKLDDLERELIADHSLLLGSLVRAALKTHPDSFPDEEHFQIPDSVADQLIQLTQH